MKKIEVIDEEYKGKLFLSSNGYRKNPENEEFNSILASCTQKGVNALFVSNATTLGHNQLNTPIIMKFMEDNGALVREIILTKENINMIKEFDIVYFTGGDIEPLLELANNTNFSSILIEYLSNGGVVFAESAGSMIFTENLENPWKIRRMINENKGKYAEDLESYKGFGLVDTTIYPHWNLLTNEQKEKVNQFAEVYKIQITALNDGNFVKYNIKELLMQMLRKRMHR